MTTPFPPYNKTMKLTFKPMLPFYRSRSIRLKIIMFARSINQVMNYYNDLELYNVIFITINYYILS